MTDQELIDKINNAIQQANIAAQNFKEVPDNGTANLDHVTIKVEKKRKAFYSQISKIGFMHSGVWWKGCREINFDIEGQGNRRYAMVQAAYKKMKELLEGIEGVHVHVYYQID